MLVHVRAQALLAIADHTAAQNNEHYGALVGTTKTPDQLPDTTDTPVLVTDAFDVKSAAGGIDETYLHRRLQLLQVVSPQLVLVGFYTCNEKAPVPPNAAALCPTGHVYLSPYKGFYTCRALGLGHPLVLKVDPTDSERNAVSTSRNNPSLQRKDLAVDDRETLAAAYGQLAAKVEAILAAPLQGPDWDAQLVHLARLVATELPQTGSFELVSSHLSLISSQVAAIASANAQVARQADVIMKRRPGPYRLLGSAPLPGDTRPSAP